MTKNKLYEEMYKLYKKGLSLQETSKLFNMTRQSVYIGFKRRKFKLRKKIILPIQFFNKIKFTPQNNGYFRNTDRKNSFLMHRYVWEFYNGKIPKGYDIHHLDRNKNNNKIENLEAIRKDEHARKYSTKNNQYTKKGKRS